jgi:hypothetical protein
MFCTRRNLKWVVHIVQTALFEFFSEQRERRAQFGNNHVLRSPILQSLLGKFPRFLPSNFIPYVSCCTLPYALNSARVLPYTQTLHDGSLPFVSSEQGLGRMKGRLCLRRVHTTGRLVIEG